MNENKLTEINSKFYQKCEVIMLPTEKASKLYLHGLKQHLYILSSEEIKEGDWFYHAIGEILKCTKIEGNFIRYEKFTVPGVSKVAHSFDIHINLHPKKIIATTNSELTI